MARRNSLTEQMQMTPMIDVMATLLAVFMFTTPLMTSGIDLDLPEAGSNVSSMPDHTMVVSVNRQGRFYLAEDRMTLNRIIERLVAMRGENPNLSVMIAGDTNANYGAVMQVMAGLKTAGFEKVSLQTRDN